jgi:hypothetical protein
MTCKSLACVCLAAAACGGNNPSTSVQLKGQFLGAASAKQSDALLLAMGWYPTFAGTAPGSPVGAVFNQNLKFQGNFPVDFTFTLEGAPPAAALFDLSQTGGKGHLAYGVLIAFRDTNGNGKFDENSAGQPGGDVIAGISVPDPSRPPPEHSYMVVYLDGQPAASDYYSAFALQQGYNLLEIHYDYGIDPVPLSTSIGIPITNSPALGLYACQAAFQQMGWFKRACGIDPYGGTWQAQGAIYSTPTRTFMNLYLNDADGNVSGAAISLDGTPVTYDSTTKTYAFTTTSQLQGTHSLSLAVPGRASETMSLNLPGPMIVSAPGQNQTLSPGSPVAIAWAPAAGTAYYDVYFLTDDGNGSWLFHTITTATSATTPPINYTGPAHVSVKAIAPLATGTQGSFVTPISQTSVRVSFAR